jgi:hypothetical protein
METIAILVGVYYMLFVIRRQYFVCKQLKHYSNKFELFCIGLIMSLCWPLTAIYLFFKKN